MAFRILNESERKNFHKVVAAIPEQTDNYDQNDESMQRRILALQALLCSGLSLGAIILWISTHIH